MNTNKTQAGHTPTRIIPDYELGSALISAGFGVPYAEKVKLAVNSYDKLKRDRDALLEAAKNVRVFMSTMRQMNWEKSKAYSDTNKINGEAMKLASTAEWGKAIEDSLKDAIRQSEEKGG